MSSSHYSEGQDPPVIYVEDIDAKGASVEYADSQQEISPTSLRLPLRRSARHRSYSVATTVEPDSEDESIPETMPSSSSTRARSSSASEAPASSSKGKKRSDDWTEVTEPEERRRIQNRIAQRKFREKVRDQRERAERDSRNQEHAGSSYHIPEANEIADEEDLSGLPWGGMNMGFVIAKGHETESRRGSRQDSRSDQRLDDSQLLTPYTGTFGQTASYDGRDSSVEPRYYTDSPAYYYDYDVRGGGAVSPPFPPQM